MRISLRDARNSARGAVIFWLLAFICAVGARGALADFQGSTLVEAPLRDIAAQVNYWPAHCAQFEKNTVASQCWMDAAKSIDRYAGSHSLTDDLKALRMDWRLRGLLLLSFKAPGSEGHVSMEGGPPQSAREPKVKAAKAQVETRLHKDRRKKVVGPLPLLPEEGVLLLRLDRQRKKNFTSSYPRKD
jgi:hypothetical protein